MLLNSGDLARIEISNLNTLQMHCSISTELVYFYIKKAQSHSLFPKKIKLNYSIDFFFVKSPNICFLHLSIFFRTIISFPPLPPDKTPNQQNMRTQSKIPCTKGFTISSTVRCLILCISNSSVPRWCQLFQTPEQHRSGPSAGFQSPILAIELSN